MYLEKEALEQKDREDFVPFTGEKKGKDHRCSLTMCCCGGSDEGTGLTVGTKPELESVHMSRPTDCIPPRVSPPCHYNDPIVFLFMAD